MGGVYSHYDPTYLRECSDAVQQLLEAIAAHMVGDLLRQGRVDQPLPPTDAELSWVAYGLRQGFGRWVPGQPDTHEEAVLEPVASAPESDPNPSGGSDGHPSSWYFRGTEGLIPTSAFPERDQNPYKSSLFEMGRLGLEPRTNTLKGSEKD